MAGLLLKTKQHVSTDSRKGAQCDMTMCDSIKPTFVHIFSIPELHDRLYAALQINAALNFSATCKHFWAEHLRRWHINRRYSIDGRLQRFVKNSYCLRSELGRHASLISGSFAVQYFAQETWPDSDLDIFVQEGQAVLDFDAYLQKEEHYQMSTLPPHGEYDRPGILEVRSYRRSVIHDPSQAEIQIIVGRPPPIKLILEGFYMTAVLNVISWNKAYSLFAKATFVDRHTYMLNAENRGFYQQGPLKYRNRGWQPVDTAQCGNSTDCRGMQRYRRIGDSYTWTIPLSIASVKPSRTPDLVLENTSFNMHAVRNDEMPGLIENETTFFYVLRTLLFHHISLKYDFVTNTNYAWLCLVAKPLHENATKLLNKIDHADRPSWFDPNAKWPSWRYRDMATEKSMKKPSFWHYMDQGIAPLYDKWYENVKPEELLVDLPAKQLPWDSELDSELRAEDHDSEATR